ncbi:MAG: tRNA glutamyl-Q(34) synthetase GluQRS [Congregibacter sp.]|nr:tRNA glutamyl-Q(34) synthetase GluQRS [Congregibacter sp.]
MASSPAYRGRFAPSPTGPLHMGSLVAAVGSYLDARAASGTWLLRIEDIDPPREAPGATDSILRSLESHGLHWDEAVLYQSTRLDAYATALAALDDAKQIFRCCCTRATLGPGGNCRERCTPAVGDAIAYRVRLSGHVGFVDELMGAQAAPGVASDLVLKRKDGLYAYALAVVVDDAEQRISHVVRGSDLISQTFAQLELFALLFGRQGAQAPRYAHLPLVYDPAGVKLSKQTGAMGIRDAAALNNLRCALGFLGQASADIPAGSASELLSLATTHWSPGDISCV